MAKEIVDTHIWFFTKLLKAQCWQHTIVSNVFVYCSFSSEGFPLQELRDPNLFHHNNTPVGQNEVHKKKKKLVVKELE